MKSNITKLILFSIQIELYLMHDPIALATKFMALSLFIKPRERKREGLMQRKQCLFCM
jgi:hypothetical protein